ncbi:phenylacetate--CoA ligase family protein [Streptomyces sp. NPDC007264]|uniref:phenylacetate--CoA ligase family protein n=1 Tax=Streptomyces sp. NPDC007264 TaxID=3364777 RepID=UPI0036DB9527
MSSLQAPANGATGGADVVPDSGSPFWDESIETLPRQELRRFQERRIADMVSRVYEMSGLVREKWQAAGVTPADITSIDDYRTLVPVMDQDDIRSYRHRRQDPFGGLLTRPAEELTVVGTTSGTTGRPTPLPYLDQNPTRWGQARDMWMIGVRPGEHVVRPLFVFRGGHFADGSLDFGCVPIYVDHSPLEVPSIVEAVQRFQATGLFLLSAPLINGIDEYCRSQALDPRTVFASCRSAVFGGEPLSDRTRSLVESWGVELFEMSSVGDICPTMECSEHQGMHLWEDLALLELLDPATGELLPEDATHGEMVVTSISDPATALVRFRTGDIATVDRGTCRCGRTHVRVKPMGRAKDGVVVAGRHILPISVWGAVEACRDTERGLFQIVRASPTMDELNLRVGSSGPEERFPAVAAEIERRITAELGVPCAVEVVPDERLLRLGPPHKIPRVVHA